MHPLIELLQKRGLHPKGEIPPGVQIDHVTEVSSQCRPGSLFVAIKGHKADGHDFLADAASRGASAALVTKPPKAAFDGMATICVDDTQLAAGPIAQEVAGNPSRAIDLVGVTGTNGKTTTVYLMEALFKAAGRKPGMLTTVVNRWGEKQMPAEETTPSGPAIARRLAEMRADGVDAAAMEVSSHAIAQHRTDGLCFRAMALTNVTQDHLDYHNTMEEYAATKMAIFRRMHEENPDAIGVVNLDDATGKQVAGFLKPEHRLTYSIRAKRADLALETIRFHDDGMNLAMNYKGKRIEVASPLHCYFNAMNILTASGLALAAGLSPEAIVVGCAEFKGAPGRFEMIPGLMGIKVIVDYAHTPDALMQLLLNARGFVRRRLIAVFGCGGDRDKTKRPKMGKAAAELAHEIIITNDNPRTEVPEQIALQILEGVREVAGKVSYRVILDRREAIQMAINMAEDGDAVVIAGKGHEDYQIMGTQKSHFDDREIARELISERLGRTKEDLNVTQRISHRKLK